MQEMIVEAKRNELAELAGGFGFERDTVLRLLLGGRLLTHAYLFYDIN